MLRDWGVKINDEIMPDLIAEFDTKIDRDLGGGGQHRHGDPDTAKMAARMNQTHSRTQVLLAFIRSEERGLTNDELYEAVDSEGRRDRDSWVPRVGELKRMGLVTGTTRKRRGNRNVKQQVNVATNEGIAFVRQKGWRA